MVIFRSLHRAASALALTLAVGGCALAGQTPAAKMREQVLDTNEEARWSRIDLAQQRATPAYRAAFVGKRVAWGKKVAIADLEVMNIELAEDNKTATSIVAISWYDQRDMTLRASTVKQSWEAHGQTFSLSDESVVDGDTTLFAEVKKPEGKKANGKRADARPSGAGDEAAPTKEDAAKPSAAAPSPEDSSGGDAAEPSADGEWQTP